MTTKTDVATWMRDELIANGYFYPREKVYAIKVLFGDGWTHQSAAGNPVINDDVKAEFKRLCEGHDVRWLTSGKCWTTKPRT